MKIKKSDYEQYEYGTYEYHSTKAQYHRQQADLYGKLAWWFLGAAIVLQVLALILRLAE